MLLNLQQLLLRQRPWPSPHSQLQPLAYRTQAEGLCVRLCVKASVKEDAKESMDVC